MRIDRASRWIDASASRIYAALTLADAVQAWLPPAGAKGVIDAFVPEVGGAFHMTLVFDTPGATGRRKSSSHTDIVEGRFVELTRNERVRQSFIFRSEDPAYAGEMVMTWTLTPIDGGTDVAISAEGVPPGIQADDHQKGMTSSLANLARYVE